MLICIAAAARDNYPHSVWHIIDGKTPPGLFQIYSLPSIVGMIGSSIIAASGLLSIIFQKQSKRKLLCFIMLGAITVKIAITENFRILLYD